INDKKTEKLLGQLLLIQNIKTTKKEEINIFDEEILKDLDLSNCMNKINELYNKAINEENIIAVNTMIEIILFMQDTRIEKIETEQISVLNYKQMLAAA
ncbi:MAG: hypothetical protein K5622_06415, partial [Endomicrobiaceae bacterium]|nr:hypothetical protein [Endomicrobiaceae bacterium]